MSAFKDFVYRKLQNHETRITNIEQRKLLEVFVDHETGLVYSMAFGVTLPVMRESIHGGGAAISVMMGRSGFSIAADGGSSSAKHLEQCGVWTFHKDRVPKCDYVMHNSDGSFRFFKKAITPADAEVTASGKIIKVKK